MSNSVIRKTGAYRALFDDLYCFAGWQLPALVCVMTLAGITEGLTVASLLPLLTIAGITGPGESVVADALMKITQALLPGSGVGGVLMIVIVSAILQMVLTLLQSWWSAYMVRRYTAHWQTRLLRSFLHADWHFLSARKSGELANGIIAESGRVAGALQIFTIFAATALAAVAYFGFALLLSWKTTVALLLLAVVMAVAIAPLYRVSRRVGRQIGPLNARLQVLVNEDLACAKIIKASASENRAVDQLDEVARGLEKASRMGLFLPSFVRGFFECISLIAIAFFVTFGMNTLQVAPADMIIVMALFVRLFPRLTTMQSLAHSLNTYAPGVLVLRDLLQEANSHAETDEATLPKGEFKIKLPTELRIVSLAAGYNAKRVLHDVNLVLPLPGMIGIVGGSGAGKSTLVLAMLGFLRPTSGTIQLKGKNIRDIALPQWRRAIGYVPQETMLFHASVEENLKLAKPQASREEVIQAAQRANAHQFISQLPQGYDTQIGDQGAMLSGGQRQRLGIARALLAEPAMLLLDEPTSALDPHSEKEVLETLEVLRHSVGIVIVAHRLATVRSADTIYLLEDGKVVESGGWSSLVAQRERFFQLAQLQHISE